MLLISRPIPAPTLAPLSISRAGEANRRAPVEEQAAQRRPQDRWYFSRVKGSRLCASCRGRGREGRGKEKGKGKG